MSPGRYASKRSPPARLLAQHLGLVALGIVVSESLAVILVHRGLLVMDLQGRLNGLVRVALGHGLRDR
jgi:hypothetical protein